MTPSISSPHHLSDRDLLSQVERAAANERHSTADLIALLAELDERRLYRAEGCASLFTYCTQVLHLSEHAAYGRIEAARAARRFPVILGRLAEGTLNLTAITLLGPHLTGENHLEVLDAARHKSRRAVEHLVARLRPRPDAPPLVRKLPERKMTPAAAKVEQTEWQAAPGSSPPVAAPILSPAPRAAEVKPLAPERYKIQFTVSRETHDKLRRAQDLLRHQIPNGDPAAIFERAVTLLVDELERTKLAASKRPRSPKGAVQTTSRHIPAAVKRAVWKRDSGRCAFIGTWGRCTETGFLEFHHVVPFADGGETTTKNLELRCRAHNVYEAEQYFGLHPPLVRETRDGFGLKSSTRGCSRPRRRAG